VHVCSKALRSQYSSLRVMVRILQLFGSIQFDSCAIAVSAEEAQQAYLSRLLLMLGSLVILCLLLF
jgi:hypothetical protein